jgi:DNA-binding MarR family transcriptional regulator
MKYHAFVANQRGLTASQQRTWLSYMRVYHRLEYEMNRQLKTESGLSLGDYTVLNALSQAPGHRLQLSGLAITIGWELSRLSHHLQRMTKRGLVDRGTSETDGRATDALLTEQGWEKLTSAAPQHAAWVRRIFFSDIAVADQEQLADALSTIYQTLLREGTLPQPEEWSS